MNVIKCNESRYVPLGLNVITTLYVKAREHTPEDLAHIPFPKLVSLDISPRTFADN